MSEQQTSGDKRLIIYSASAGAGKTYTLTGKYLRLLFQGMLDGKGVQYANILVATFTNKATTELRERVLKLLHEFESGSPDLKREDDLLKELVFQEGYTDQQKRKKIRALAREALEKILEDYGRFRVQTIDSFFQEVVRSFTLELSSIRGGFEVEIDRNMVLQLSLDRLIDELQNSSLQNQEMLQVLEQIFRDGADDGARVDLRSELTGLLGPLMDSEIGPLIAEKESTYMDTALLNQVKTKLKGIAERLPATLEKAKEELEQICDRYGVELDKSSGKCLGGLYVKLSKDDVIKHLRKDDLLTKTIRTIMEKVRDGDDRAWLAKSNKDPKILAAYRDASGELLQVLDSLDVSEQEVRDYNTALLMLKYVSWIPAMLMFKKTLDQFQRENNIVLISEINPLLRDIIDGSDIPFIYEKVGTAIRHYMLDEFQDTSHVQWENFDPLLSESLAQNNLNYLVGDVKQSIYRFRGADSTLLGSEVPNRAGTVTRKLEYNYRSTPNVIDFNNRFFSDVYDFSGTFDQSTQNKDFEAIYAADHVKQKIPQEKVDDKEGYVRITAGEERITKEELHDLLREVYSRGYEPGDIALLFRKNKHATEVAQWLRDYSAEGDGYSYDFISDEALALKSSPVVKALSALVHYLAHPGDVTAQTLLNLALFVLLDCDVDRTRQVENELLSLSDIGVSIYETITEATLILQKYGGVKDEDHIYVGAYMDQLFNYTARLTPTYLQFDNWWQASSDKLYIEMPESDTNSIRLMTIHSAKGLEFPIVIMPFASWDLLPKSKGMTLMKLPEKLPEYFPTELPYYYMKQVPAQNVELKSHFKEQYIREYENIYMDELNLLYVAFTRAERELHVFTQKSAKPTSPTISNIINATVQKTFHGYAEGEVGTYEFGTPSERPDKKPKEEPQIDITTLSASPQYTGLTFMPKRFESTATRSGEKMHYRMEFVRSVEDFDRLFKDHAEYSDLFEAFHASLSDPRVREWFTPSDGWEVLAEPEFYSPRSGRTVRADRVLLNDSSRTAIVLDYKFGAPQASHKRQVAEYMTVLREMGYTVSGYLWYHFTDIVPVQI